MSQFFFLRGKLKLLTIPELVRPGGRKLKEKIFKNFQKPIDFFLGM